MMMILLLIVNIEIHSFHIHPIQSKIYDVSKCFQIDDISLADLYIKTPFLVIRNGSILIQQNTF
jgi:hypothetical protein